MVRLPSWSLLAARVCAVARRKRMRVPRRRVFGLPEPLESRAMLSVWAPWSHPVAAVSGLPFADHGGIAGHRDSGPSSQGATQGVTSAGVTSAGVTARAATSTYDGYVGFFDPVDVFRFELAEDSEVQLELTGIRSDLDLRVYDAYDQLMGVSENPGTASESLSGKLSAGTYFVEVYAYAWYDASDYRLQITSGVTAPEPPPTVPMPGVPSAPSTPNPGSQTPPSQAEPAPATPTGGDVAAFPDVPYFGGAADWNLNAINAPEAWAQGYTGWGVVVAVIDTGVELYHSDLASNLWLNADEIGGNGWDDDGNGYVDDVHGWDFVGRDNDPSDYNGHGTHVAGTIAAANNGYGVTGVAPDAQIMPVRVLDRYGSATPQDVAAGIRYAVDNGADVVNLSLGGPVYDSAMRSALVYASQHGALIVAAAGNSGGWGPDYPAQYGSSLSNVISVGAHDSDNRHASFSNAVGSSGAVQVDAPGVDIRSTYAGDQYTSFDGTSMAAPHVTGLAALAISANPNLSAADLRGLIVDGADRPIRNSDSPGIDAALTVALAARTV